MANIFERFFSSAPKLPIIDLSALNADMHSHFIPGIDDGAKTIEDSVELIKELQLLGYKKIITTPHIMSDFYKNTPEIILSGLQNVRQALKKEEINIEIDAAAEYYLDFDFERKIDTEKLLTFGSNYLLFEISYMNPPDNMDHIIFKLQTEGYKPVLAHPERYPFWHTKFEKFEQLKDKGVLLQLNINSLTGYYSHETKKIAEQFVDKDMIDFLGTDCHHVGHVGLLKGCLNERFLHKVLDSKRLLNGTI